MVRNCIDNDMDFVITISDSQGKCMEYGTICRITRHQAIDDNNLVETEFGPLPRYLIEVSAIQVVRISNQCISKHGYLEGQIELIHDCEPDDIPDFNPRQLESLVKDAQDFVRRLLLSIPPAARLALQRQHGHQPVNQSEFSFWLAELLPLSPALLYNLLPINNAAARLEMMVGWIQAACNK